jgi:hypothetical protein
LWCFFYLLSARFFIIYTYSIKVKDMPAKTRIIIVSLLILLGGALFAYCVLFYPIEIATPVQGGSATVAGLKAATVKDASTTASEQDKSSQTNQNRSGGRSRPRAGAT